MCKRVLTSSVRVFFFSPQQCAILKFSFLPLSPIFQQNPGPLPQSRNTDFSLIFYGTNNYLHRSLPSYSLHFLPVKLFCLDNFPLKLEPSQVLLIYGFGNCPHAGPSLILNFSIRFLPGSFLHEIRSHIQYLPS